MTGLPTDRLYQLAERLLDVQERDVSSLRGRTPTVAAAAAVAATLLAPPASTGSNPGGLLELACFGLGAAGLAAVLAGLVGVLVPRRLLFAAQPGVLLAKLSEEVAERDSHAFDSSVAAELERLAEENGSAVRAIHQWFSVTLVGVVLEVVGFAAAAGLAS